MTAYKWGPRESMYELETGRVGPERRILASGQNAMTEIASRIVVDENVRFGKPVIKGTRVPVDLVVGKLAGGMTLEEVADEYGLIRDDVLAALAYAAKSISEEQIRAIK